jgi:hypothetical protein
MKSNLIKKITLLIAITEYIENVNEALNVLYVKALKCTDYYEVNEVEYEVKKIVELNGLEG